MATNGGSANQGQQAAFSAMNANGGGAAIYAATTVAGDKFAFINNANTIIKQTDKQGRRRNVNSKFDHSETMCFTRRILKIKPRSF